jgi:C1A family cysteine protease
MQIWFVSIFAFTVPPSTLGISERMVSMFKDWQKSYNLTFVCKYDEDRAMVNWMKNVQRISELRKKRCNWTYDIGLWEFSHKDEKELDQLLNGLRPIPDEEHTFVEPKVPFIAGYEIHPVPSNVTLFDWTQEGGVIQRIRDQGECACCYAIASTGALEGQIFRKTGNLTKLSDQQIIDCSKSYGNNGCGTGSPVSVYEYIRDNGITAGINYPFKAEELGTCLYNSSMEMAKVVDYRRLIIRSDEFLKVILQTFLG